MSDMKTLSIHDPSTASRGGMIYREEIDVDPNSQKKLDEEFEDARSRLHNSKMKVRDRSREVSDQKQLNSELKNKLVRSPNVSPFKTILSDIESENSKLEGQVKYLVTQLKESGNKIQGDSGSILDEIILENRYSERETINFILKSQNTEFEHLRKLLMIFQEENVRMTKLMQLGQKPTDEDVVFITENIARIRKEIDAILNGRHELAIKLQEIQARIEFLTKENEDLRKQRDASKLSGSTLIELQTRIEILTKEVTELRRFKELYLTTLATLQDLQSRYDVLIIETKELRLFKESNKNSTQAHLSELQLKIDALMREITDLRWYRDNSKPLAAFIELQTRLDVANKENQELRWYKENYKAQMNKGPDERDAKIKNLLDQIDILKRDLQWAQITKPDGGLVYKLEHENSQLQNELENLKRRNSKLDIQIRDSISFSELKIQERDPPSSDRRAYQQSTVKKNLSEFGGAESLETLRGYKEGGYVSSEEIIKLQNRIREFGECNMELESMIFRLKAIIEGGQEEYYSGSNYNSTSAEKKFSSADGERFHRMVLDLQKEVDRLCLQRDRGDGKAKEMLHFLETILSDSLNTQKIDTSHQLILKNNSQIATNLSDLQQLHDNLESKYNSLLKVNSQNERYVDDMLEQVQDLKNKIKNLQAENEDLRQKMKENNTSYLNASPQSKITQSYHLQQTTASSQKSSLR